MADVVTGYGILQNDRVDFTLNGLATAAQIERLIKLTAELISQKDPNNQRAAKELKNLTSQARTLDTALEDLQDSTQRTTKKFDSVVDDLESVFRPLMSGNFSLALKTVPGTATKFAVGVGVAVGALTGYADKLKEGLQIGVAGDVFDLAIAAKSAGINMQDFTKALGESGGSFAQLGDGATSGAKQFGVLVNSVRQATASVGNLGMNNEEMAVFTARQLKVAVGQGFRGRQAQEAVISSSRGLAEELDMLAYRTGKNVMKLAEAAMKLAQDPLVSNFVARARQGGAEINKSVQQFMAGMSAMFGEAGEQLAGDAIKSAMTGLPLIMAQSGKNILMASQSVYSELERQAKIAKDGGTLTEADQQRMHDIVLQEVKTRGQQLEQFQMMGGPMGEAAGRILEMAREARNYNTEASKERRAREKTAQDFNAEVRKLQASLQQLLLPFLKGLNAVDWTGFFSVFNFGVNIIKEVFSAIGVIVESFSSVFELFGLNLEKGSDYLSKFLSIGLGLVAVLTTATAATKLLTYTKDKLTGGFMNFLKGLIGQGTRQQTVADRVAAVQERVITSAQGVERAFNSLARTTERRGGRRPGLEPVDVPDYVRRRREERRPVPTPEPAAPAPGTGTQNQPRTPTSRPSLIRRLGGPLAMAGGILGGMALDSAADKAEEAGEETAASFLRGFSTILSHTLTGAGIGGMVGGPWGALAVGLLGALTGTVSAFSSDEKPIERQHGSPVLAGSLIEDFGKGTLAMLHGREGVITERQLTNLAKGMQENTLTAAVDNLTEIIEDQPTSIFGKMLSGVSNVLQEKFAELKKQNQVNIDGSTGFISSKITGSMSSMIGSVVGEKIKSAKEMSDTIQGQTAISDQDLDKKLTSAITQLTSTDDRRQFSGLGTGEQFGPLGALAGSIGGVLEQFLTNSLSANRKESQEVNLTLSALAEPRQNVTAAEMIPQETDPGKLNSELRDQQVLAVDQASKLANMQLEEMKKFNANLATLTDESAYGNAIAARNITMHNDGNRYIREIAMRGSA